MDRPEYIPVEAAAHLEGVSSKTFQRRVERKRIILGNDPQDLRRKLVPLTALSPRGYQAWLKEQAALAFAPPQPQEGPADISAIVPASPAALLQPALPFGRVSV